MAFGSNVAQLIVSLKLDDKGFSGKLNDAAASLNRMDAGLSQMGRGAGQVAGGLVRLGAVASTVAIGGIAAVTKIAADFDSSMTQSLAIMGNVSDEMREKMEKAARDVAKTTTFSASEAADAYFYLASAGLDAQQAVAAMPQVSKFAQAGMFDMALATDLLTDAQSALGMTIRDDVVKNMENMTRVSDVLVKANTIANATVQQFSESLTNRAGAALRLVNKDVEEGVAVLAAMADQGVKGAEAGTRLDIVLRDLQVRGIKNADTFKELGVRVFDSAGNMNNLADIVGDLEGALGGLSDEQRRATLMQLGFQDRSVAAILSLVGMSDAIRGYESDLRSASGVTEEVANKQLESFSAQLGLLKDNLLDAGITIGTKLLPVFGDLAKELTGFLQQEGTQNWIADFAKDLGEGIRSLVGELRGTDFSGIIGGLKLAAEVAKGAFDAFRALPAPIQQLAIAALVANKVSGGAIGMIAKGMGNLLLGSLKTITAANVTVVGTNVMAPGAGVGGLGGAAAKGGGLLGGIKTGAALASPILAGVAAVEVKNFMDMRTEATRTLEDKLDAMPRATGKEIDASISRIEGEISKDRPFLEGILFNTNVKPILEQELGELQAIKTAASFDMARLSENVNATTNKVHELNMSETNRHGVAEATRKYNAQQQLSKQAEALSAVRATQNPLERIAAKDFSPRISVSTQVYNSISVHEWQRTVQSASRAYSDLSGGI
jgi:TP901 family phage tail tape measure protein